MKLLNKVGIITGAGQGIGRAIALVFAQEGANVVVNDIEFKRAVSVAEEIKDCGGSALPIKADVSLSGEVENMLEEAVKAFNNIDILVNNAGIQTNNPFWLLSEEEWQRVIDVNLKGTFLCSKAVVKYMIKNKVRGKIINVSSIHQMIPRQNKAHYDASKAGVMMLTKDMALELAQYRINVNCIAPGAIITPMNDDILSSAEKLATINARIPWGRMGRPEEVANVVLYLASDEADYITGSVVYVDGGLSLC